MTRTAILLLLLLVLPERILAQNTLIFENDAIRLYESFISEKSKDNLFPSIYKEGLFYVSGSESKYYSLFYSPNTGQPQKIRVNSRFRLGGVAAFNDEIYFTGLNLGDRYFMRHLTVYKGILKDNKITKIKPLSICNRNTMYAHPSLTKDGNKMIIVTNEKNRTHLLELKRNEKNEWERSEVVYIAHPSFDLINPTYYDENTIYFSSNYFEGGIADVEFNKVKDTIYVSDVRYETTSYNIYRIRNNNGTWQVPELIPELSSDFDDLGVLFTSPKTGYLTSFRFNDIDNIYFFEIK